MDKKPIGGWGIRVYPTRHAGISYSYPKQPGGLRKTSTRCSELNLAVGDSASCVGEDGIFYLIPGIHIMRFSDLGRKYKFGQMLHFVILVFHAGNHVELVPRPFL